jgi:hypothetical protein
MPLATLNGESWAQPVIKSIRDSGGIVQQNMPLLFEARIAYALYRRGVKIQYEYPTGVGSSSVDFHVVSNGHSWLIEIVKIGESAAAAAATHYDDPYIARVLRTPAAGATKAQSKQSPEGELLLVEQKITEKVMRGGKPIKFPAPTNAFHMIIVDTRAFLNGGDADDYAQIAYGPAGMKYQSNVLNWPNPDTGKWEPIKGLFHPENPLRGAKLIHERVHFLGFVAEKVYKDGEISKVMIPFSNPLFADKETADAAWNTHPLSASFSGSR